jgi:hypothetical protein
VPEDDRIMIHLEFINIHPESELRIREAVSIFEVEFPAEPWSLCVSRRPEEPSCWLSGSYPDGRLFPHKQIPGTADASDIIIDELQKLRESWQERTTPLDSE